MSSEVLRSGSESVATLNGFEDGTEVAARELCQLRHLRSSTSVAASMEAAAGAIALPGNA